MISLERWRIIEPILDAALELPESQRDGWVSQQCADDPELHSTLTRLLASIARTDSEFDQPARSRWGGILDESVLHEHDSTQLLGDRFRIEQPIGRGGTGTVYRAYDQRAKRVVAVRILNPDDSSGDGHQHRDAEVRRTAALRHPNIVPVFDSGESAGSLYFVMPFIEGESLADHLAAHERLPLAEVRRIMVGVLSALAYAHETGVIHRDVRPSHIVLSNGEVLLTNFAISQPTTLTDRKREDGTIEVGTPDYTSPEQTGATTAVDKRTDIYSAGCILVEALTGQRPLPAALRQALAREEHDPELRRLTSRLAGTPDLLRCATRAIALNPADRFQTAQAFLHDLLDAVDQAPIVPATLPMPDGALSAVSALRQRNAIRTLAIAATVLAVAITGIVLARRARSLSARSVDIRSVTLFPLVPLDTANRDTTFAAQATNAFLGSLLYTQFYTGRDGSRLVDANGVASNPNRSTSDHAAIVERSGGGTYVDGTWWRDDSLHLRFVVHMQGRRPVTHVTALARGTSGNGAGEFTAWVTMQTLGHPEALNDNVLHSGQFEGYIPPGLQAYREQRYGEAARVFREVNLREPPYPFAALIGAEAASWIDRPREAQFLSGFALRGQMNVVASARALEMTRGFDFFVFNRADSAIAHLRRVVSRDGPALEAWLALGTIYDRLAPRAANPDSLAADALAHASAIDSDFLPSLYLRLVLSVRRGDTATSAALLHQLNDYAKRLGRTAEFGTESNELRAAVLIVRCTTGGAASAPWDSMPVAAVIEAARALTASGLRQPDCARTAWERAFSAAGRDSRLNVLQGLQTTLIARGQIADAQRLLDSDTTVNRTLRGWLTITDAMVEADTALNARAAAAADSTLQLFQSHPSLIGDEALWYLGLWLAHSSQADKLRVVHDTLLGRVTLSTDDRQRHFQQSLAARVALARGDTSSAITLLSALTPSADRSTLTWTPSAAHGADRLLLAELLLAKRQFADAVAVASYFDAGASVTYPIFLWRSLQIRAMAASRLSNRAALAAIRQRQRALRPLANTG